MYQLPSCEGGNGSPSANDPFGLGDLMNLEFNELCSPSSLEQSFSSFWASIAAASPGRATSPKALVADSSLRSGNKSPTQRRTSQSWRHSDADDMETFSAQLTEFVPKPLKGVSFAEKMLKALSLLKDFTGGGSILAQIWMPFKQENGYVLTTSEQPYLLDQMLASYREISTTFIFYAMEAPGRFPGLPGRVFTSGMPEWTSNVIYYRRDEYLRVDHALNCEVRGSLAMPIYDPSDGICCAVLELVTTKEKPDFDVDIEGVFRALQTVDLTTIKAQAHQQKLSDNKKRALVEIFDVLRTVCCTHSLPLALTWIPVRNVACSLGKWMTIPACIGGNLSSRRKVLLCVQEMASYVNDPRLKGFLHACTERLLEIGQGVAGKAFQSNGPIFSRDIKGYCISEYPLVHHARKFGLQASVAIRLRSSYTKNDDYVLEFFLPESCGRSADLSDFLNNLAITMQRSCKSLRTVSGSETILVEECNEDKRMMMNPILIDILRNEPMQFTNEVSSFLLETARHSEPGEASVSRQMKSGMSIHSHKKHGTSENISFSVLQQYFSGSLKNAAKSIGVCPTTLKRICRQHGISRWPSRKISKVNRSLKKIQNVIQSVGVESSLKYDPTTGTLITMASPPKEHALTPLESVPVSCLGPSEFLCAKHDQEGSRDQAERLDPRMCDASVPAVTDSEVAAQCLEMTTNLGGRDFLDALMVPCSIASLGDTGLKAVRTEAADVEASHSHHSSSGMTDSSSGSASSRMMLKRKIPGGGGDMCRLENSGSIVVVKATYMEDTVRFKLFPPIVFHKLEEEIQMRFKRAVGTFKLKYMDDENDWVIMASDLDLTECMDVLDTMGSHSLKLLVSDVAVGIPIDGGGGSGNHLVVEEH